MQQTNGSVNSKGVLPDIEPFSPSETGDGGGGASSPIWASETSLARTRERRPSRLRRSLARSREARFTRANRRACSQATKNTPLGSIPCANVPPWGTEKD